MAYRKVLTTPTRLLFREPTSTSGYRNFLRGPNACMIQIRHDFPTPQRRAYGSLFNLGGLSTSRECQYFSKERGVPRTEFSPFLELIRSSEVDTQDGPGSRPRILSESEKREALLCRLQEQMKVQLDRNVEEIRVARAHLSKMTAMYDQRSRDASLLVVITAFLSFGLVFAEDLHNIKNKLLRSWWLIDLARVLSVTTVKEPGQTLGNTHKASDNTASSDPETQSATVEKQPPLSTSSGLFWASTK